MQQIPERRWTWKGIGLFSLVICCELIALAFNPVVVVFSIPQSRTFWGYCESLFQAFCIMILMLKVAQFLYRKIAKIDPAFALAYIRHQAKHWLPPTHELQLVLKPRGAARRKSEADVSCMA